MGTLVLIAKTKIYSTLPNRIPTNQGEYHLKITIDYLGHIKKLLETKSPEQIDLPRGASLKDLLLKLAEKYGQNFKNAIYEPGESDLKPNIILTVNGLLLNQLNGINTQLKNGDTVTLMPIVSGG